MEVDDIEQPSDEELREFEQWKDRTSPQSLDIPYALTIGAVNIVGVLKVRDPLKNSSTKGVCAGIIVGEYELDKNNTEAKLYGPLLRLVLQLRFDKEDLRARLDTQRWDGSWRKGDWKTLLKF